MPRPEFRSEMGTFIVRFAGTALPPNGGEEGVENRIRQTLAYLAENGRITSSEYGTLFHRTQRQAQRDLAQMVRDGLLLRRGRGQNTYYLMP